MSPGTPTVSPPANVAFIQSLPPFALIVLSVLCMLFATGIASSFVYQVRNADTEIKDWGDFWLLAFQPGAAIMLMRWCVMLLQWAGVL